MTLSQVSIPANGQMNGFNHTVPWHFVRNESMIDRRLEYQDDEYVQ